MYDRIYVSHLEECNLSVCLLGTDWLRSNIDCWLRSGVTAPEFRVMNQLKEMCLLEWATKGFEYWIP